MKKQLLSSLILAGASLPVIAQPIVYGKANVSFQSADENGESTTELKSNASRIGVKGKVELESGFEAIYKAEFEVQYDDGEKDEKTFTQRNIYVGLKGDFGTVKAGKFDTPFKKAQKKIDLFNDLEGDIKNIVTKSDNRASNIVSYETPKAGGFSGKFAYVAKEKDGVDDGVSVALAYEIGGLYVSAAFDQNVEREDYDAFRAVAQYNIGDFQVGALYEAVDEDGVEDTDAAFVSFKYTINKFALKAQYGTSDIAFEEGESFSLGFDYKLAKQVKLFTYYTALESDADLTLDPDAISDNDYLGAGIEVKF